MTFYIIKINDFGSKTSAQASSAVSIGVLKRYLINISKEYGGIDSVC